MAEEASPKRPAWFWPVVAVVVLVLAAGGVAAPSIIECSGSEDGFGTCMNSKLADLGLAPRPAEEPAPDSVAVAQPAETVETPEPVVTAPDFGVRVEPNGSIVIAGSGAAGKTVEIYVNGELYGTAEVGPSGDWVLVPDAPLPPGGYELTLVDPETGVPLDKSFVVAINEDLTSEPLVVATAPGEASEILQGLGGAGETTVVAEADSASDMPAVETDDAPAVEPDVQEEVPAAEPEETVVAEADTAATPADTDEAPAGAEPEPSEPPAEEVASAEPAEDVVGDVDALEKRVEALEAMTAPTIDAVEIDKGRNFFAGTGADGAIVRLYVDNVYVGDAEVEDGRWLLETDNVLENRSQRVRADQLMPGSSEVVARAEIDFIFEEPAATPSETAVAEAPVKVPEPDFGIDTDEPVPAEAVMAEEEAPAEDTVVAEASEPASEPEVAQPEVAQPAASAAASGTAASDSASGSDTSVAAAEASVAVPEPDFAIDTGIPVTVVSEEAGTAVADADEAVAPQPEPEEVPQLVAAPVGAPELGRFATGKAIIRSGDNLWTIARRVYGSGYRYTQIYGANRDQIRDPDLIYPGQVFDLPDVGSETDTASN